MLLKCFSIDFRIENVAKVASIGSGSEKQVQIRALEELQRRFTQIA